MNNLDLRVVIRYPFSVREEAFPVNPNHRGLPTMKLILRVFALAVVFAGAAAASVSSSPKHVVASHQSATASFPIPTCGPGIPCGPDGN